MKRKFLLLTLMCILMGGVNSLFAQEVTIGSKKTTSNYFPARLRQNAVGGSYNYSSISQQIYTADEIKAANGGNTPTGKISKLAFKSNITNTEFDKTVKVYMRNIGSTNTITAWDTSDELKNNKVYDGTVNIDENGYLVFNLNPAFDYKEGNNILICVDNDRGSSGNVIADVAFDVMATSAKQGAYVATGTSTTHYGFDANNWPTFGNSTGKTQKNVITITFSTGSNPVPTFKDTYVYPSNDATNIFNPYLKFYAENKTHYKVLLSTDENFSSDVRYIAGGELSWVESPASVKEVSTANISGLTYNPATKYYWKVIASNGGGADDPTEEIVYSFTTKEVTTDPVAVTYKSPENGATGLLNPELTWTYGDNTVDYQVIIDNEVKVDWTNIGYATTGSYQTSGLSSGEHTWQVNTRNNNETYTEGEVYTFTVASLPDNVTPLSPANGATGVTSDIVRFQFAPNTTEYRLLYSDAKDATANDMGYISVNQGGTGSTWTSTGGATEMEFTIPYFGLGKTLYWAVDVKNSLGQRSVWNGGEEIAIYSFTAATSLPVANVGPENGTNNHENPVLSWNFIGDATHYMVYLGTEEDGLTAKTEWLERGSVGTGLAGSGSYQTEDLTPATKYFWRVDVKEGETVLAGDVWSFVTTLPKPEAQANPAQVVPSFGTVYGGTTINWSKIETAQGYNVYLDDVKLNNDGLIPTNTNYYAIPANSMKLQYNMTGYTFNVEAVYEGLGSVKSENVTVKVTGTGFLQANIHDNDNQHQLEGATITLTCIRDEFGNEYSGNEIQYVLTTDAEGHYYSSTEGNKRIQNGTYDVTVEKTDYASYTGTIIINNNATTPLEVILKMDPSLYFAVSLREVSLNSATIYLENADWSDLNTWGESGFTPEVYFGEANYFVYLKKNGGEPQHITTIWFDEAGESAVKYVYEDWSELGKGNYQIGVARRQDKINWSAVQEISYDVFEGTEDASWSNTANWRDLAVPATTAEVYVLAPATIAASEKVTVGTVNIQTGGSLTINGSLTAGAVYNNTLLSAMQINDGGQLRQSNQNLNGKFVMTVTPPTSWDESNIDGWQFIASPVEGVEFSNFVPANDVEGDYDLYQYDGDNDLWRNHKHVYDVNEEGYDFGSEFVLGTAYLAALQYERDVIFSGTFNAATTHTFNVSYSAKRAANFHLLGNPFTFDINTANLQAAGLETGYAVINAAGNDYEYFVNGTIPVGNGFFVFANEATASLRYAEVRGAAEATNNINIVARGEAGSNNVVINFAGEGEGFPKLEGFNKEVANIYVANAGNKYAIYNCESNVNEVELTFVAKQMGSYSLSFDLNGEFESVVLVDRLTGAETDMMVEDEYNFIATSEDMKNRFVVRFANGQSTTANSQFVYQSGDELIINAEGAIEIIDMMGRVVYSSDVKVNRVNVSNFNNAAYVVRALNEGKVQKVVIY